MSTLIALSRAPFFGPAKTNRKRNCHFSHGAFVERVNHRNHNDQSINNYDLKIKRSQRLHVDINRLEPRALLWAWREKKQENNNNNINNKNQNTTNQNTTTTTNHNNKTQSAAPCPHQSP